MIKDSRVVDASLVYNIAYLGGSFDDYTENFSRGSSTIVMQHYNFLNFGRSGYRAIMDNCLSNTRFFIEAVKNDSLLSRYLTNISNQPIKDAPEEIYIPVIALTFPDPTNAPSWTLTDLSDQLAQSGWVVPAYSIPRYTPEDTDGISVLRVVVQQSVTRDKLYNLLDALRTAIETLEDTPVPTTAVSSERRVQRKKKVARHTACLC